MIDEKIILDTKKTSKTPKDKWEAIELMNEAQQNLVEALHIMNSVIEDNTDESLEISKRRIRSFVSKFKK